jgi:hypothetical protein
VIGFHRGWKSNHKSSILLVGCVCENVLHMLVALLSWKIAPRVPLPRSGLNWIPDSCFLTVEMCFVCHVMW